MSFLNNFFGNSDKQTPITSKINWIPLTDLGQLNEIITLSNENPVFIFKHSTRCSISRMALKQFENEFDLQAKVTPYFLDLLEYRSISNEIATRFNVMHQSPQLLLIKNGIVIYHVSLDSIDAQELKNKI